MVVTACARAAFALALAATSASCAIPHAPPFAPDARLLAPDGASVGLLQKVRESPWTVLVFYSPHCHCLDAHEPRLRALAAGYGRRGVAFVMVDSEVGASVGRDREEAEQRGYTFPILVDPGGRLATALGAQYATYAVVLDAVGRVRYRGGMDSDKTHLTSGATPYLANAIEDLMAGREPRVTEGKTLGCSLQTW